MGGERLTLPEVRFLLGLEPEYASLYIPYWNRESSDRAAALVERGILTEAGEGISRKGMWFDITREGRRALVSSLKLYLDSENSHMLP